MSADNIRRDKRPRIENAAIDVAFRREVHDGVEVALRENPLDEFPIADIATFKFVTVVVVQVGEICEVTGICQTVDVRNRQLGIARQLVPNGYRSFTGFRTTK